MCVRRRIYLAAHYLALAGQAKGAGLKEMAARQLTAALRYVGIIPPDKVSQWHARDVRQRPRRSRGPRLHGVPCSWLGAQAFYEAGMAWKDAGRLGMAFVMLNRYLDLCDAMDEPDSSAAVIENADFADTDVPFDFHVPHRPFVNHDEREEVRESRCVRPIVVCTSLPARLCMTAPRARAVPAGAQLCARGVDGPVGGADAGHAPVRALRHQHVRGQPHVPQLPPRLRPVLRVRIPRPGAGVAMCLVARKSERRRERCCSEQPELCRTRARTMMRARAQMHERIVAKSNGVDVVAIRDAWNQWVNTFRTCPVTGGSAVPMY